MIIHPGAAAALRRLGVTDELAVAQMIQSGELASPQRYENMSLFNVRVTGTGVSFRPMLNEFVIRDPDIYLTPEFLARCNGLPVIFVHPKKNLLNSDEFNDRVVGMVMLPYIRGEEVWAVCRIYDQSTIDILDEEQMSTSPGVLLGKSEQMTDDRGNKIIIEGKPTLLDHLAIVSKGVWDKGGEATGIDQHNIRGDSAMADEKDEKAKADAARADAARMDDFTKKVMDRLDAVGAKMDACTTRMDAWDDEKKKADSVRKDAEEKEEKEKADKAKADKATLDAARKDGEDDETVAKRLAADKAKSDAEDEEKKKADAAKADKAKSDAEEEEKKKMDAARADSVENSPIVKQLLERLNASDETIKTLSARIPKDLTDADMTALTRSQARADEVFMALGGRAPVFLNGETNLMYRRRMASSLKKHSAQWKDIDLDAIRADAFENVEGLIYADAAETARSPSTVPEGELRCVSKVMPSGHRVNEYIGNPSSWMNDIAGPVRQFAKGGFKTGSAH